MTFEEFAPAHLPWRGKLVDVYFTAFPGITSYDWVPHLPPSP
jgi:hypothetical protein